MTTGALDLAIFAGFYAWVLAFSLRKSRGGKTSADYFLGGAGCPGG